METLISAVPFLPVFFTFFLIIYLLAHFTFFRHWNAKDREEASSCCISLAHGTPAAAMAAYCIFMQPQLSFASPNTICQNAVLDYSVAYFFMDLLHYVIFFPSDFLFIGHHLATCFVMITCRYHVRHGAVGILALLLLAELTSFCQNVWTLAGTQRAESRSAAKLYELLSPPFYSLYTLVRGLFGPFLVYKMGVFYLSGKADSVIPRWVSVSWMVVVVSAISVSILWISNRWMELYKENVGGEEEKKKM